MGFADAIGDAAKELSKESYPFLKDVVKANPITPSAATSSVSGGNIDAAAQKLSADAYALMKDVDWTSNLYLKKPGQVSAPDALAAVDKALVMGAGMDSAALQEAAKAH